MDSLHQGIELLKKAHHVRDEWAKDRKIFLYHYVFVSLESSDTSGRVYNYFKKAGRNDLKIFME